MPTISIVMLIAIRLNPVKFVSTYSPNVKLVCQQSDIKLLNTGKIGKNIKNYFKNAHAMKDAQMDAETILLNVQIQYVRNVIQYPPKTIIIWKSV